MNEYIEWLNKQISFSLKVKNFDMKMAYEDALRKYKELESEQKVRENNE